MTGLIPCQVWPWLTVLCDQYGSVWLSVLLLSLWLNLQALLQVSIKKRSNKKVIIATVISTVTIWIKVQGDRKVCCGRESRLTCQLSCSGLFPMDFSTQSWILRLPYTFTFFDFPHVIELLIILFYNFETQVDSHEILKSLQDYSTRRSHRYVKDHAPSRFLTSFSLSARRIGYWISFFFYFL